LSLTLGESAADVFALDKDWYAPESILSREPDFVIGGKEEASLIVSSLPLPTASRELNKSPDDFFFAVKSLLCLKYGFTATTLEFSIISTC
jgi:hypothetical protein